MPNVSVQLMGKPSSKDAVFKYVHQQLIKLWKDSVKSFIKEAQQHIHIDTGMSMASLQPLAANVRLSSFLQESLEGRGFRKGGYDMNGAYDPSKNRSKAAGRRAGEKAYLLSFGTHLNPELTFSFKIQVYQWYLHELGIGKGSVTPWRALDHGKKAFINHFNTHFKTEVKAGTVLRLITGGK